MIESTAPASSQAAGLGLQHSPTDLGKTWFVTREGRRYGREILAIVVLKLALLGVLWFAFIKPWLEPAAPRIAGVQQLYSAAPPVRRHD